MEVKIIRMIAQRVTLCAVAVGLIFTFFGKAFGAATPDSMHSFLMHIRGEGDVYVRPAIGVLWYLTNITFVGGIISSALLALIDRDQ